MKEGNKEGILGRKEKRKEEIKKGRKDRRKRERTRGRGRRKEGRSEGLESEGLWVMKFIQRAAAAFTV